MKGRNPAQTGGAVADREHRSLLELIDRYASAVAVRAPLEQLVMLVERLMVAAREHIEGEEAEMRRAGYPQAPQHYMAHAHLLSSIANLLFSLRGARLPSGSAVSLKDWLARHLTGDDAAFYAWLDGAAGGP